MWDIVGIVLKAYFHGSGKTFSSKFAIHHVGEQ